MFFVLIGAQPTSVKRRIFEFIWDARAGPVLLLNIGEKRLGFAFFCHRRPERSFVIQGHTFPLCSRCTGLLLGFFGFISLALFNLQIPLFAAFMMLLLLAVDGTSQLTGLRESNNLLRLLTGVLFTFGFLSLVAVKL
ncbi:MAG TPA: DUF2085 domain-containing protein [Candidatus Bathyarchaeia archaeon]|nr:DUF2085 domain-containing protein [Candidatus Bathyarchaeia archaeon]